MCLCEAHGDPWRVWHGVSPLALQKSCRRDPRPLARFRRSLPGRTLMCLLLPYTVPVQLMYYRGKR